MEVTYIGPLDAVEIASTGQIVERDETVDVSAEIGAGLLEQTDAWRGDAPAKTAKSSKKAS